MTIKTLKKKKAYLTRIIVDSALNYNIFSVRLFILLSFPFLPLHCLYFFDWPLLITPSVPPNVLYCFLGVFLINIFCLEVAGTFFTLMLYYNYSSSLCYASVFVHILFNCMWILFIFRLWPTCICNSG
jgi:hypothetical protein